MAAALTAPVSASQLPAQTSTSIAAASSDVQLAHYRRHRHRYHRHYRHCRVVCHGYWHRGHCHGYVHRHCHWH
jgi:hypothetical protein